MHLKQLSIYAVCAAFIVSCATSQQSAAPSSTESSVNSELLTLIENAPAANAAENAWLYGELVSRGPSVVRQLTSMLVAPGSGDDTTARYALNGLTRYVSQPGADQQRIMVEKALLDALQRKHSPEIKVFLMAQLELIGSNKSVPVLQGFIGAGRLHESAVHALQAIDSPQAHAVLIRALSNIKGEQQLAVIKALGDLQLPSAAEELLPFADSNDWATQRAALYALAQTGSPVAIDPIATAIEQHDGYQKTLLLDDYTLLATRLAQEGHAEQSNKICANLLSGSYPVNIKAAALTQLTQNKGAGALDKLLATATHANARLRTVALRLLAGNMKLNPPPSWFEDLDEQSAAVQIDVIDVLGCNGEMPVEKVKSFLESKNPAVKRVTINAVAAKVGEQAIPLLLNMLVQSHQPKITTTLKQALLRQPTQPLVEVVSKQLPSVAGKTKLGLIDMLAQRRASGQLNAVLNELENASPQVRMAILTALDKLATADDISRLIALLPKARNEEELNAIQHAIVQAASDIAPENHPVQAVIEALKDASAEQKPALLAILPKIGGKKALDAMVAATQSSNKDVRQAVLLALTRWPNAAAIPPLQKALKQLSTESRSTVLPGYIRLVTQSNYSSEDKVQFLNELLKETSSPEEKVILIKGLAMISSNRGLQVIASYFDTNNAAVQEQAYQSAAKILARSKKGVEQSLSLLQGAAEAGATKKIISYIQALSAKEPHAGSGQNAGVSLPDYSSNSEKTKGMNVPPEEFTALFNGKNLEGWQGQVGSPEIRAEMSKEELHQAQQKANEKMRVHWSVRNGVLYFDGKGESLVTEQKYKDFVMLVDWKIEPGGDGGIYLRSTPQVQIWDITEHPQGSGGLYNNQSHPSKPLVAADNPVGQWNSMRVKMVGEKVTVHLNDKLVVDGVVMENYWNRNIPIYPTGFIKLQAHNHPLYFKNIFIREIPRPTPLFNGKNLKGWVPVGSNADSWHVSDDGILYTEGGGGGWLSTAKTYDDFRLELEFRLPKGGNSGVFIRAPREGNPAYQGIEIQLLDDYADQYTDLEPWQYTGSIYDVKAPSQRVSKKAGTWQKMTIIADGPKIKVKLNGHIIINTSLVHYMDRVEEHPGLKRRSGYIGLQNHHSRVDFRNIIITEIK